MSSLLCADSMRSEPLRGGPGRQPSPRCCSYNPGPEGRMAATRKSFSAWRYGCKKFDTSKKYLSAGAKKLTPNQAYNRAQGFPAVPDGIASQGATAALVRTACTLSAECVHAPHNANQRGPMPCGSASRPYEITYSCFY